MLKRLVGAAVHQGLRPQRLRRLVERELTARRTEAKVVPTDSVLVGRVFVDRHGTSHPLDPALRNRLKPQWRTMCDPVAVALPPSDEALATRARNAEKNVAEASALVTAASGAQLSGRILEVGCYDGSIAFQLARMQGTDVVGSDLARYYRVQRPGDVAEADIDAQQDELAILRHRARQIARPTVGRVEFIEDDITATGLDAATFDAIVSFEVLEHVQRPAAAFESMARLLKPGGILYHDYNPFFSSNGGHSLCTLDFPWGHVRLDAADFERYVREIRPTETEQALRFYRESLNRMTIADLRDGLESAGLEILAVVPWTDRKLVPQLGQSVLAEVRRTYPTAITTDLLATFVSVIARGPA
jgi:2-polyprenyl-3-methyl-5-hydroxy-6-metoxy-1,4-benzoquinol methylase